METDMSILDTAALSGTAVNPQWASGMLIAQRGKSPQNALLSHQVPCHVRQSGIYGDACAGMTY
jgi:hypothetical protein